jgi:hypothetical protein
MGCAAAKAGASRARVLRVQREAEEARLSGAVVAFGQPRADDHGADRRMLQHPARRDVGDGDAVPPGDRRDLAQQALEHGPAAHRADEAAVLHLGPVGDVGSAGSGRSSQRSERKPPPSVP